MKWHTFQLMRDLCQLSVRLQLICVFQDTTQGPTTNMTHMLTAKVLKMTRLIIDVTNTQI